MSWLPGILTAILGSLITALTVLAVSQKTQRHNLAMERRRSKLAKGEELVAVLSELSSWRAREDQALLTEIAQIEAKLNRGYALAITYFGNEGNLASTFYSEGLAVIEQLNEIAEDYLGASPPADPRLINSKYAVFQVSTKQLTQWILEEMRRVDSGDKL